MPFNSAARRLSMLVARYRQRFHLRPPKRAAQRGLGREVCPPNELGLERVEEGLGIRVVAGPADARTLQASERGDARREGRPHVLRAAVAVEDDARGCGALARCRAQDRTGYRRRPLPRERPGENAPRVLVHDDREVARSPAARMRGLERAGHGLDLHPGSWLRRTAMSLNASLYFRTARGRARRIGDTPSW